MSDWMYPTKESTATSCKVDGCTCQGQPPAQAASQPRRDELLDKLFNMLEELSDHAAATKHVVLTRAEAALLLAQARRCADAERTAGRLATHIELICKQGTLCSVVQKGADPYDHA